MRWRPRDTSGNHGSPSSGVITLGKPGFDAARYVSVLDEGLPDRPARMQAGQPVPVAVWIGPRFGAVLVIEDCPHDPYCEQDEHYVATHYTYRRGTDGWELPRGSGSSTWPGGPHTRASLDAREVLSEGGSYGGSNYWTCRMVLGFAGPDARWVELKEGGAATRRAITESGAYIAVTNTDGPAEVNVLDQTGGILDTYRLPPAS